MLLGAEHRLYPYSDLLTKLLPHAFHEKILSLLASVHQSMFQKTPDDQLLDDLFLELKRISAPSMHPIDLRTWFQDCFPFMYGNVTHYIDKEGETLLNKWLPFFYGKPIPSGIHQFVLRNAKDRYVRQKENASQIEELTCEKISLRRTLKVETPRPEHTIKATWTEFDPSSYTNKGVAEIGSPIEVRNLSFVDIRLSSEPSEGGFIHISFHDKNNVGNHCVIRVTKSKSRFGAYTYTLVSKEKSCFLVLKNYIEHFNKRVTQSIKQFVVPLRENLKSVQLEQQSHKTGLPLLVLCKRTDGGELIPTFGLRNIYHDRLLGVMSHPSFSGLWSHPQLKSIVPGMNIQGVLYVDDTKLRFSTLEQLGDMHEGHWSSICGMAERGDACFIMLRALLPHGEWLHDPSTLPDHVGPEFCFLNQLPPENITRSFDNSQAFQFLDITDSVLLSVNTNAKPIPLRGMKSGFICMPTGSVHGVTWYTGVRNEFRMENRYSIQCPVRLQCDSGKVECETVNISTRGMMLRVNGEMMFSPGDLLILDVVLPLKGKTKTFFGQSYKVVGQFLNGNGDSELRLKLADESQAIHRFIRHACREWLRDGLCDTDHHSGHFSFYKALRNINAANPWFEQVYLRKNKFGFEPEVRVIGSGSDSIKLTTKWLGLSTKANISTGTIAPQFALKDLSGELRCLPNDYLTKDKVVDRIYSLLNKGATIWRISVSPIVAGDRYNSRDELRYLEKISPSDAMFIKEMDEPLYARVDHINVTELMKKQIESTSLIRLALAKSRL